ncbi:hypothetical protein PC113_g18325 [Phytophthora cactorum]|uniref:Uncharacterized protein n=1 Tax=Phytophthora cactorum TaxID=29920 RepID=A0A8T0YF49_9STRA|nr:hypothetical protein PC113_g18325 [Phytophthora cactorum]
MPALAMPAEAVFFLLNRERGDCGTAIDHRYSKFRDAARWINPCLSSCQKFVHESNRDRLNDKGYRHQPGLKNGGQGLWDSFTMDCGPIMDGTKILAPPSIVPNHLRTPARLPSTWHNNCDGCEKLSREHKYSKRSERKLQGACV